ncbi:RHS repeat-associated core domain-containing protein [Nocardiopsis sp. MG754419]|uniref:RHS repeat-associated core domain-containing protein n=1 Tax=Nocardiopsis sp. MG754419 TaxID=2259865 RepID=UPI0020113FBB|nr:RHS repeat-associated core domain-containing protein [Nocardiopsis sp. MG754419]
MVDWAEDERFHYTLDGQNTVLVLTAEGSEADAPDAVYEYSPYGEQSSDILEDTRAGELNPFGYTGAYQFQDGTVHLSHRFYDTFTLGFTQPDPSRQEMNNHNYAACDPINKTDSTGLCFAPSLDFIFGFFGYGVAAYTVSGMVAGTIAVSLGPAFIAGVAVAAAIWEMGRGIQALSNCWSLQLSIEILERQPVSSEYVTTNPSAGR